MNQRTMNMVRRFAVMQEEVTLDQLAEEYGVSSRTIRNDLNEISLLLQQKGGEGLALKKGGVVQLPVGFAGLASRLLEADFYEYKMSKEERVEVASAVLVNAVGYVTLSDLAELLVVSRATVINDLNDIKEFIRQGGMEVKSHPNRGLMVIGKELTRRSFLLRMLTEAENSQGSSAVLEKVHLRKGNPITLQKIVREQERRYQQTFTDASFRWIVNALGIMLNRNEQGELLEDEVVPADNRSYTMAQETLRYVAQYCDVKITEGDICLLSSLLHRCHYAHRTSFESDIIKIQVVTRQFIDAISEDLGIDLCSDYTFFENLSNHLQSVFSEPAVNYPESGMIAEILEEHEDVQEVVQQHLSLIASHVNRSMTKTEIDYIAVHICAALERRRNNEQAFHVIVACHAGLGTSRLLLERLKKHFDFRIVDIITAHEAKEIDPSTADFVISTVPLPGCPLDYIIVSANINDEDYVRLGNKIEALRSSRKLSNRVEEQSVSAHGMIEVIRPIVYQQVPEQASALMKQLRRAIRGYMNQSAGTEAEIFSPYLHHLLPAEQIELDVECSPDWRDAVRRSAQPLLEQGYIEARYIDAMIANIEENGPYIVLSPGFAVPHEGLEQGSIRTGMHLIRLKEPVDFGSEEGDPVRFVCCLSAIDHKTHLKAFFNLVNMLQQENFKKALTECKTPQEAESIIEQYEYSVMG